MKKLLIMFCCFIAGCSTIPRPGYFQDKLNNMFDMNNQLGAMIGYNTQKFNGRGFMHERYYQTMKLPVNQFEWQLNQMTTSKIKGKYGL